ncbi:MAG: DUF2199 domain-containing protein [Deltaproteobacteria bacterium]|nr:DUF2199 domain-containing protein [Deltaproteobacteria bacterium]
MALGDWGEAADPAQRAAFYCRVRPTADSYQVMLGDADESPWSGAAIVGQKLSREQALRHPWKAAAFEVLDDAFEQDPSLRGFMLRVQCGDAAVPIEHGYQAPDDIFALGEAKEGRAELGRCFASLDVERFFVRCLLTVPVETYESWSLGLWIEVARADYDRVRAVWDDPEQYPSLRFSGVVANVVDESLALPIALGQRVELAVLDPDTPPRVVAPASGELAARIGTPWPRLAFEPWAVARGFL